MTSGISYNPYANVRYNTVPNTVTAPAAAAAEGGFVGEVMGGSLPMVGFQYGKTIYHAARHPKIAIEAVKQTETIIKGLEEAEKLKGLTDVQKAAVYGETYRNVNKAIRAGKNPKFVTSFGTHTAAKSARAVAKAGAETAANIANATTATGKAWAWTKGALKSGGFKGMAIFSALFELPELYAAFSQGGVGEGLSQTVKSTAKVAGDAAGWALGAAGGAKAGAVIGSFFGPGIGTAIGAAIGTVVGGLAGSWLGRKTAKAVTGKSFSEKAQEQEQQKPQITTAPTYNPANMLNVTYNPYSSGIQLNPYIPVYNRSMYQYGGMY